MAFLMTTGAFDKAQLNFLVTFFSRFAPPSFFTNFRLKFQIYPVIYFCHLQVAGTSGKALLEGGSDDEGASTEAHGRAIIEVLGRDKRNEVLAALYMVRTDVSLSVRQVCVTTKDFVPC